MSRQDYVTELTNLACLYLKWGLEAENQGNQVEAERLNRVSAMVQIRRGKVLTEPAKADYWADYDQLLFQTSWF